MKILLLAAFVSMLALAGCSASQKATTDNIPTVQNEVIKRNDSLNIVVDGAMRDWTIGNIFSDRASGVTASMAIVRDYLYIAIHFSSRATEFKLLSRGLDLSIDTVPGNLHNILLRYPLPIDLPDNAPDKNGQTKPQPTLESLLAKANIMESRGFNGFQDGMHRNVNEHSVSAVLGTDGAGNLIYEAGIPLQSISPALRQSVRRNLWVHGMIKGLEKKNDTPAQSTEPPSSYGRNRYGSGMGRYSAGPRYGNDPEGLTRNLSFNIPVTIEAGNR